MKVYLVIHPRTRDVDASTEPITDNPDWERRELDVKQELWPDHGRPDGRLTIDWWDRARPDGAPLWPLLP